MEEHLAIDLIKKHFPDLTIKSVRIIGEGSGNVALEINYTLIFRFPKNQHSLVQLAKEISIQEILKKRATLPFPRFTILPQDHSFV
jgi:hypothetical protein